MTATLQRPTPAQARALNWLLFSNITSGISRLTRFRVAVNPRTRKSLFASGWAQVTETVDGEFVEITDTGRAAADRAHSSCDPLRMNEVRMSGCAKGCKVMACRVCGAERVVHSVTYGCQIDEVHAEALEMATAHISVGTLVEIEDPTGNPDNFAKAVVVRKPSSMVAPNEDERFHWVRYDNGCIVPVRDWRVRALSTV